MRTISVRLDDRADAALTAYCERHGITQTTAVKAAIECLAGSSKATPAELAAHFGLIGGFRSRTGDLAENHSERVKQRLRARRKRDTLPPASAKAKTAGVVTGSARKR
jgi:hypothetical protein